MKILTANQLTYASASTHVECLLIEALVPDLPLRYTTAGAAISWNGQTWLGGVNPSWISPLRETTLGEAVGLKITISGVSSSVRATAFATPIQGAALSIWIAVMNPATYQIEGTPILDWQGVLDVMYPEDSEDGTTSIVIEAENEDARFLRPNTRRYTDRDHQRRYPGDTICRFASQTERTIVWPTAEAMRR